MPTHPEWTKIHNNLDRWNAQRGRGECKVHRLLLKGPVPSKKNEWRFRANGSIGVDRETQSKIDALILQARIQWGPKKPLEHPAMEITLHVATARQDRDNMASCLLDILTAGGVIVDDRVSVFNGPVVLQPARQSDGDPFTEIVLTEYLP